MRDHTQDVHDIRTIVILSHLQPTSNNRWFSKKSLVKDFKSSLFTQLL